MKDGVRLAATLYRPDGPAPGRLPVVFEYLPYRKDDGTLAGDYPLYAYMVAHGYVGARVDVRGTGRSEGRVPEREYSEQEQQDGVEVIAWLARQPWCNGSVGMWGMVVGRLQRDPDRGAAPAGAEGDPARRGDRGPVPGRHPLHRRPLPPRRVRARDGGPAGDHALSRLSARREEPRGALRRSRRGRCSTRSSSATGRSGTARRCFRRATTRIADSGPDDRRLVRRLPRHDPAHAREAEGAAWGDRRPLEPLGHPTRADPGPRSSGAARPCGSSTSS